MSRICSVKNLLIALLLLTCGTANAQIKSYVGIVREQYFPGVINLLTEYKEDLQNAGYFTYAKYVDAYLKGGFGSGFVYVDEDGANYIITNRHVVSQASSATIEFEQEDGSYKKFEGLVVVATDDDIDIAVLKFSDGSNPFKKGLSFADSPLNDGNDVWSAGFPGLGNDPVWQLSYGTVTNSKTRIKELLDPSISTLIQHSAEIDSGNSGGPLLVKADNEIGFAVAGINTWKARSRQSTNYAIPAALIKEMIHRSVNPVDDETAVQDKASKYFDALNDKENDFTSIAKYISFDSASKKGKKSFESILRSSPTAVRNRIVEEFAYSPVEGLRYAEAYQMWIKFSTKDSDADCFVPQAPAAEKNGYTVKANDNDDSNVVVTTWVSEHGIWRLNSAAYEKASKGNAKKAAAESQGKTVKKDVSFAFDGFDLNDFMSINLGYEFNGDDALNNSFYANLIIWTFWDSVGGIGLNYEHGKLLGNSFNMFGAELDARLPLSFTTITVAAVCKAGFGIDIGYDSDTKLISGYYGGGVEVLKNSDSGIKYGLGLSILKKSYVLSDIENDISSIKLTTQQIYFKLSL